ncbi:MAG: MoaD/ThiS family protein [Planctomycetota bacterium]
MRVRVRYFADAREAARRDGEDLDLAAGATVKDAVDALVRRHPALGSIAPAPVWPSTSASSDPTRPWPKTPRSC